MPIPAIATTGSAQKGCSMLATCSPMATAIVVAETDAFSATAAGMVKGPCTAQWPPPLGMTNEMRMDEMKLRMGRLYADADAAMELEICCASPVAVMMPMMP